MELMDTSLDKFYKYICERMQTRIPETILAKITLATVKALNYLKEKLKIIHRLVLFKFFMLNSNYLIARTIFIPLLLQTPLSLDT